MATKVKDLYDLTNSRNPIWFNLDSLNPVRRFYGHNETLIPEERKAKVLEMAKRVEREATQRLAHLTKLIDEAESG